MNGSRRRFILVGAFLALVLTLPWLGGLGSASAQALSVTSANPSTGEQGTLNLNVVVTGKGFKSGAKVNFYKTGTLDPSGVAVKSTQFASSSQLVANIDIADTAALSRFDIQVANTDGRTGKGTELFSVVTKKVPEPVWTVTLPVSTDAANVFGPGVPLTNDGTAVIAKAGYTPPTNGCTSGCGDRTSFELGVTGNPWRLGIKGIESLGSEVKLPDSMCWYPTFDDAATLLPPPPYADRTESCIVDFLNGHAHPQGPYTSAHFSVELWGLDLNVMPIQPAEGSTVTFDATRSSRVRLSVGLPACYTDMLLSGAAGIGTPATEGGTITITRVESNRWDVEVRIGLRFQESYARPRTSGKASGCAVYGPLVTETAPIFTRMTWTRQ